MATGRGSGVLRVRPGVGFFLSDGRVGVGGSSHVPSCRVAVQRRGLAPHRTHRGWRVLRLRPVSLVAKLISLGRARRVHIAGREFAGHGSFLALLCCQGFYLFLALLFGLCCDHVYTQCRWFLQIGTQRATVQSVETPLEIGKRWASLYTSRHLISLSTHYCRNCAVLIYSGDSDLSRSLLLASSFFQGTYTGRIP